MCDAYNPFSLEGKTILVTGASSGIGRATAIECAKMGAQIIVTGRNKERLDETYGALKGSGHQLIIGDLRDAGFLDSLVAGLPVLDGLVNNAGFGHSLPVKFITEEALSGIFSVNTFAPIMLTRHLAKRKLIRRGGSIVFTSSISGVLCAAPALSMYAATKGAINGFIKGAAIDFAPMRIRVNSVIPGMVETNIMAGEIVTQEQLEVDKKRYPLGRYGKPEEVAHAIIYLLSDASQWVTGSNLLIDGGYTLL